MTRARVANLIVTSMETAGWLIFLFNSKEPITYGVLLLWISSTMRRDLAK